MQQVQNLPHPCFSPCKMYKPFVSFTSRPDGCSLPSHTSKTLQSAPNRTVHLSFFCLSWTRLRSVGVESPSSYAAAAQLQLKTNFHNSSSSGCDSFICALGWLNIWRGISDAHAGVVRRRSAKTQPSPRLKANYISDSLKCTPSPERAFWNNTQLCIRYLMIDFYLIITLMY